MELAARRWAGRFIRFGLVGVAILLVALWGKRKFASDHRVSIQREPVAQEALAPGDMRIFSVDSSVDLVLQGDRVLAGLSPKTVAKVRAEMERSTPRDTSGLGGLIASTVKSSVSDAIGTHVVYPVADIREISYSDGRLVLMTASGRVRLFSNTKVSGTDASELFSPEDAQRFVEAVRARQASMGIR